MTKIDKFYEIKNLLRCPRCGRKIRFHKGGLVCKKEHRFDISSKGYVNLLQENRTMKGYDSEFFQSRNRFFKAGYYDHVAEAVIELAAEAAAAAAREAGEAKAAEAAEGPAFPDRSAETEAPFTVIDAGCGEGFYAAGLCRALQAAGGLFAQVLAFDISAEAVKIAARNSEPVKWMVADITNIPVRDGAADCILDIFTPASYQEFARILKPSGLVIKAVPGSRHMEQLRRAAAPLLRSGEYSNEEVLDYFAEHFDVARRVKVSRTMAVSREELTDLVKMTPLLFNVDKSLLDLDQVKEITVEAEILAGRPKAKG